MQNKLTEEQEGFLKKALWDLNINPEKFLDIIKGKSTLKWFDCGFRVTRLLESVNWFKVTTIIKPKIPCYLWQDARKHANIHYSLQDKATFVYNDSPFIQANIY